MFLGNLSTATERTTRKATSGPNSSLSKQKLKADDDAKEPSLLESKSIVTFIDTLIKPMPRDGLEAVEKLKNSESSVSIVYNESFNEIPRDIVLSYLKTCSLMINHEENMLDIISWAKNDGRGLQVSSVNYQQEVMERHFGIERKFGCKFLAQIPTLFAGDHELIQETQNFIYLAMRAFIVTLSLRYKTDSSLRKRLKSGEFSRESMLEFFEGCNALMTMNETKAILRGIFLETNKPPNEKIIELQRNTLELLGFDADYACSHLNQVGTNPINDVEVGTKMQHFAVAAQLACRESTMNETEKNQFYEQIPPLMKSTPYIFFIQQQQQAMAMAQQQAKQAAPSNAFLQSPESMQKIQHLSARLDQAASVVLEKNIQSWTSQQRESYFDEFALNPVVDLMSSGSGDAMTRIQRLFDINDDQLVELVTMQNVMMEDMKTGGSIAQKIKKAQMDMWAAAVKASKGEGSVDETTLTTTQKIGGLLASLGSVVQMNNRSTSASHGHDHNHDHGHHGPASRASAPDVTSGKSDKMVR